MNKIKYLLASCLLVVCSSTNIYSKISDDTLFVATTFTPKNSFTSGAEGPAVDKYGNLYAVNYNHQGTIGKVTAQAATSLFVELPNGSVGNGIRFNRKGDMFIADYKNHNILKVNMDSKSIEVYAHDSRMNQPNDIAITDNDVIYASDPNWGESTGNLWMIDTNGTTHLLESGMSTTNGIEVSPDNKTLYVGVGGGASGDRIWAYDILPNDSLENKRSIKKFFDGSVLDGMRTDSLGNLYVACYNKKKITILTPDGEVIREVATIGSKPTNIAFGGADGKTCYVTIAGNGNIETFRTDTPGRSWIMNNKVTEIDRSESSNTPSGFKLEQNYPNPFNPTTTIGFALPTQSDVNISVYNVVGEKVAQLANSNMVYGNHIVIFDGSDLVSGMYVYKITAGNYVSIKKMMLLK